MYVGMLIDVFQFILLLMILLKYPKDINSKTEIKKKNTFYFWTLVTGLFLHKHLYMKSQ